MNKQLKKALLNQKEYRDGFEQNRFINRLLINKKESLLNKSLIKIIKGPRRAGKSTFLFLLLQEIDFIYVNFDEIDIVKNIDSHNDFLEVLHEVYGNTKNVFLDEIQNMPNWELFLNKLEREGYNVYVTGSNSDLLSEKFASSLTGRYISFEFFPFSFYEYLLFLKTDGNLLEAINFFLKTGGFPEVIVNDVDPETYVSDLLYSIIYKDIIKRYNIRNYLSMDTLVSYLISNFCQTINLSAILRVTKVKSEKTLKKYLKYIENSYICTYLSKFDFKSKKVLTSRQKIYFYDNSLLMYKNLFNSSNMGSFFENLIFNEMVKKGIRPNYDFFYYETRNGYEVDFILKQGEKVNALVQVCYDILDEKTEKREIRALLEASEELHCSNLHIVTKNTSFEKNIDGKIVKVIPFSVFYKDEFGF